MEKVLLLLSGGFDSPVAGCLLRERGFRVGAVHFKNQLAGKQPEEKARKLAVMLGFQPFVVDDITQELQRIAGTCDKRYYFVLQKRLMLRRAAGIARRRGFSFLATGESLAQVSSQTARNLAAINQAAPIPVLRPLIGFDKNEIISIAKHAGTYETS
ncbi:tRNA 4-thiouridine(8) synthase ThiI, partial [Candidatus Micrarchaeota archaeon]|nr:tRNA 4-thiouridine(8) synthase ThiI [Candidatus Micrarchaeota archaeon]